MNIEKLVYCCLTTNKDFVVCHERPARIILNPKKATWIMKPNGRKQSIGQGVTVVEGGGTWFVFDLTNPSHIDRLAGLLREHNLVKAPKSKIQKQKRGRK